MIDRVAIAAKVLEGARKGNRTKAAEAAAQPWRAFVRKLETAHPPGLPPLSGAKIHALIVAKGSSMWTDKAPSLSSVAHYLGELRRLNVCKTGRVA